MRVPRPAAGRIAATFIDSWKKVPKLRFYRGFLTGDGFGADDQRRLADLARDLVARGCKVMLSNSDTPFTRAIYAGLRIDRVFCSRAINCNAARRGDVAEVIALG